MRPKVHQKSKKVNTHADYLHLARGRWAYCLLTRNYFWIFEFSPFFNRREFFALGTALFSPHSCAQLTHIICMYYTSIIYSLVRRCTKYKEVDENYSVLPLLRKRNRSKNNTRHIQQLLTAQLGVPTTSSTTAVIGTFASTPGWGCVLAVHALVYMLQH